MTTSIKTVPINMPSLGVSMTEGTLVQWLANDGDVVAAGQLLYVVATDKVENEIPSPAAGVLRRIAAEDQDYAVGAPLGHIEQEG